MSTFDVDGTEHGLESIGPFSEWRIKLDGYEVPQLGGRADDQGMFHLCLDRRFGIEIPEKYAQQVVWLIANALAIGAGYSCFGENSQQVNPFKVRFSGLSLSAGDEAPSVTEAVS